MTEIAPELTTEYDYTIRVTWRDGHTTETRMGRMFPEHAVDRLHLKAMAFVRQLYAECKDVVTFSAFSSSHNFVFYSDGREVCSWEVVTTDVRASGDNG